MVDVIAVIIVHGRYQIVFPVSFSNGRKKSKGFFPIHCLNQFTVRCFLCIEASAIFSNRNRRISTACNPLIHNIYQGEQWTGKSCKAVNFKSPVEKIGNYPVISFTAEKCPILWLCFTLHKIMRWRRRSSYVWTVKNITNFILSFG